MTAPAPGGVDRGAPAERVVQQAQQRHTEDVDGPAPELRVQQVEVGAIVQDRERCEGEERAGDPAPPRPGTPPRGRGSSSARAVPSLSVSHGPAKTTASAAESTSPESIRGVGSRRRRRIDQVGQQTVSGVLDPVAAVRSVERQNQGDLAGKLIDAIDARQAQASKNSIEDGSVSSRSAPTTRTPASTSPRISPVSSCSTSSASRPLRSPGWYRREPRRQGPPRCRRAWT